MKKIFCRLVQCVILLVLCLVILLNLWQLTSMKLTGQELPTIFGWSDAVVLSGSMEPTFSIGDLLVIHEEKTYQCGDIITFSDGAFVTTHRIVEETAEGFITRGDYNNVSDPEVVTQEQIRGRVVKIIPKLGSVFLFMRTPLGIMIILIAGLLLLFLPERLGRLLKKGKRCIK